MANLLLLHYDAILCCLLSCHASFSTVSASCTISQITDSLIKHVNKCRFSMFSILIDFFKRYNVLYKFVYLFKWFWMLLFHILSHQDVCDFVLINYALLNWIFDDYVSKFISFSFRDSQCSFPFSLSKMHVILCQLYVVELNLTSFNMYSENLFLFWHDSQSSSPFHLLKIHVCFFACLVLNYLFFPFPLFFSFFFFVLDKDQSRPTNALHEND